MRKGIQRLYVRPATDHFRHDTTHWMDLVPQLDAPIRGSGSGSPAVVVVQLTHDGKSDHLLACLVRGTSRSPRYRNLLLDALPAVVPG